MDHGLKCKTRNHKICWGGNRKKFSGPGTKFLDLTPETQAIKGKTDKLRLHQNFKTFALAKEKRSHRLGEKDCNNISNKGL